MQFEVFLRLDDDCPHTHHTFNRAADETAQFVMGHHGLYLGPRKVDGKDDPSAVIVDLTQEHADALAEQDFVERLPIGGAVHRGVFPYTGPEAPFDELNCSFGGTS